MNEYNDADYIELTIKCLYRDRQVLQKAMDLQVSPKDFGTIPVYNLFVDAALSIQAAPINPQLCLTKVKELSAKYNLTIADIQGDVVNFWEYIYREEPLNSEYILKHLAEFVKFRRYQAIKIDKINTPEELVGEANKIIGDIELKDSVDGIRTFDPFEQLVVTEHKDSLITGFPAIDMTARGLNYQEFGMILGHSGSGKTAMAVYSALQNAKLRRKVLYLSLEEPAENICSRMYSNIFRIPYTDLHKGNVIKQNELREAFGNMTERDRESLKYMKVHDLRDVTPLTCRYIQNYLDKLYEQSGYHPDLVYIDQLDYLTTTDKYDAEWQKYGKVAFEVDDLTNHLIGGKHPFTIWLLHQAAGKMTRRFSNGEISGFKGIIKPTDMCLAIGRDSSQDQIVSIFSLKSRHSANFQFDYMAELEYMNFEQVDKAADKRVAEEDKDKQARRNPQKSCFNNIPSKPVAMLPKAGTGFTSTT